MGEFLTEKGECIPNTMAELERKIKLGRGRQKELFRILADTMSASFGKVFSASRVQRKWQTLVDGFKKAKANDIGTCKSPSKFTYYKEMDSLIGSRHDIEFPVTGTAEAVTVHRADQLAVKPVAALSSSPSASEEHATCRQSTPRKRKRETENNSLLAFMKESDAKSGLRQDKLLDEMVMFRGSFVKMFDQLLNKL